MQDRTRLHASDHFLDVLLEGATFVVARAPDRGTQIPGTTLFALAIDPSPAFKRGLLLFYWFTEENVHLVGLRESTSASAAEA